MIPKLILKEELLLAIILVLVMGSLLLAVLDPNYRQPFSDLAKIGISGFIGLMMPVERSKGGNAP